METATLNELRKNLIHFTVSVSGADPIAPFRLVCKGPLISRISLPIYEKLISRPKSKFWALAYRGFGDYVDGIRCSPPPKKTDFLYMAKFARISEAWRGVGDFGGGPDLRRRRLRHVARMGWAVGDIP